MADFGTPTPGVLYEKFSGNHFLPNVGANTSWAYWDNGSVYPVAADGFSAFFTRFQLPQGTVLKQVEFSYRLAAGDPMQFFVLAFDGQNNFLVPFTTTVANPTDDLFRTVKLDGAPLVIDNSTWAYTLRCRFGWASPTFLGHPPDPLPPQLLWGARIGFQGSEGRA